MKMRRILNDHLTRRDGIARIDQNVEMTGTGNYGTGGIDLHTIDTHLHFDRRGDGLTILQVRKLHLRAGRNGRQRGNSSLSAVMSHLHSVFGGGSSRIRAVSFVTRIVAGNHSYQQGSRKKMDLTHVMIEF